jgi:hypothetical protein
MDTSTYPETTAKNDKDIDDYITQLSPQEKLVLKIAQEHLASSFNIEKSIGFIAWKNKQ